MRRKSPYADETLLIYRLQFGNRLQRRKARSLLRYSLVARKVRRTTRKGLKVRYLPKHFQ